MKSSYKIAEFLQNHPEIKRVFHPALPSHPQHDIACKQSYGHSGIFSFVLKNHQNIENFLAHLKIFMKNEMLGSFESFMTRAENIDLLDSNEIMIISSIGLENVSDLIEDLKQALNFEPKI